MESLPAAEYIFKYAFQNRENDHRGVPGTLCKSPIWIWQVHKSDMLGI